MTWPLSGHLALGLATGLTCGIAASRYPDVIEPPYAAVKRRSQNLEAETVMIKPVTDLRW
jgi:hypothetical protein